MLRRIAAVVIAACLIAGPALAQGTNQGTLESKTKAPATTSQPTVKADVKVQKSELIVTKTKKHLAMSRHHRRHFAHLKHVKHVKYAKHGFHLKHVKQVKQPVKNKIAG
jgi:hypothetical protein